MNNQQVSLSQGLEKVADDEFQITLITIREVMVNALRIGTLSRNWQLDVVFNFHFYTSGYMALKHVLCKWGWTLYFNRKLALKKIHLRFLEIKLLMSLTRQHATLHISRPLRFVRPDKNVD